ncbi:lactococcin 972 family bacteriocin [Pseudonocardia sp. ICBG601]|uniref:lactococcin 972 family bacteriocin n=1 Tax=Pseudonocardia sp. ICBG601 TaxID=2846759 RepID=UPI001CF63121
MGDFVEPWKGWSNHIHPAKRHGATTKRGGRQAKNNISADLWAKTRLSWTMPGPVIEAFWRES